MKTRTPRVREQKRAPITIATTLGTMSEAKYKSEDSMTKRMIFAMTKRIRNGKFEFRTKKL